MNEVEGLGGDPVDDEKDTGPEAATLTCGTVDLVRGAEDRDCRYAYQLERVALLCWSQGKGLWLNFLDPRHMPWSLLKMRFQTKKM